MNILIGQNHLYSVGGTETFTYSLIEELKKRKEVKEICVIVPHRNRLGVMSDKIKEDFGIQVNKIPKNYLKSGDKKFDLCIISHNTTMESLLHSNLNYNEDNVYQVCHGTIPDLEQPFIPKGNSNIKYIAISQEIKEYLNSEYNLDSQVIHNGIDCERFKSAKISEIPSSVLSLSQNDNFNILLKEICDEMDLELVSLNKHTNPDLNVEKIMKKSDIIISLGRGAYEGMACSKFVIIADDRGYQTGLADGAINKDNIDDFLKYNCSGRAMKILPTKEFIEEEILKYNIKDCKENREYALKTFNIKLQADKYLKLKPTKIKKLASKKSELKNKIIIFGFAHTGTSILKSIIGHIEEVEEITNEIDVINKSSDKRFIVCKYPICHPKFFTPEYEDYIKIFITRNPLWVFSSIIKKFMTIIDYKNHSFQSYIESLKSFIHYTHNPKKDLHLIRYEDMFENNFEKLKDIFNKIGLKYTDKIFDNTQFINTVNTNIQEIPNTLPIPENHAHHRTYQINQPFVNHNKISKIYLTESQKKLIQEESHIRQIYPDIKNITINIIIN